MKKRIKHVLVVSAFTVAITSFVMASCSQKPENGATSEVKSVQQDNGGTASVVQADEFEKLAADSNAVIIDVRTPDEYSSGHIEGAINMNVYDNFKQKIGELDTGKTYLLYCRSGSRSHSAMQIMKASGFKSLYDLQGGIGSWEAKGKPVK